MTKELSEAGKEQVAMALILLKDWKCDGVWDAKVSLQTLELADHLGVREQYDKLITQIPRMRVTPR